MTTQDGIGIDNGMAQLIEVAGGMKALALELDAARVQWEYQAARLALPVDDAAADDDRDDVLDHAAAILLQRAALLGGIAIAQGGEPEP